MGGLGRLVGRGDAPGLDGSVVGLATPVAGAPVGWVPEDAAGGWVSGPGCWLPTSAVLQSPLAPRSTAESAC